MKQVHHPAHNLPKPTENYEGDPLGILMGGGTNNNMDNTNPTPMGEQP